MSHLDAAVYGLAAGWLSLAIVLRLDHEVARRRARRCTACQRRRP